MAKFNCKPEACSGYIEKNKELLNDVNRLETENARLTAIVEGLPDETELFEMIFYHLDDDETEDGTPPIVAIVNAIHARLHNPTIRKSLTVDNAPAEQDKGDQKQ